jgi:hypothetical protein
MDHFVFYSTLNIFMKRSLLLYFSRHHEDFNLSQWSFIKKKKIYELRKNVFNAKKVSAVLVSLTYTMFRLLKTILRVLSIK